MKLNKKLRRLLKYAPVTYLKLAELYYRQKKRKTDNFTMDDELEFSHAILFLFFPVIAIKMHRKYLTKKINQNEYYRRKLQKLYKFENYLLKKQLSGENK